MIQNKYCIAFAPRIHAQRHTQECDFLRATGDYIFCLLHMIKSGWSSCMCCAANTGTSSMSYLVMGSVCNNKQEILNILQFKHLLKL